MTLAWHFCADKEGRPVYRDGTPVVRRRWLRHTEAVVMCESGFHASKRVIDALGYAPGPWLCRVEIAGEVIRDKDKLVCARRRPLAVADISSELHEFSWRVARRALLSERKAGREPDARSWAAVLAKRDWLARRISDAELAAAWRAAWSTARSAAESAAWSAAWSVAESAAWSVAWSAAEDAARSAARNEVWNVAESVVLSAAWNVTENAAWNAAEIAARIAARNEAWSRYERLFRRLLPPDLLEATP